MTVINASKPAADARERFVELIATGIAEAQALVDVLHREHQVLVACDGEGLAALMADKQARLARLDELDTRLREQLARAGASGNQADVARWLASGNVGNQATENWRTFIRLLRCCRQQNRINGAALGLQRHTVERALRGLRGGAPAAQYGRGGLAPGFDPQRSLGRV